MQWNTGTDWLDVLNQEGGHCSVSARRDELNRNARTNEQLEVREKETLPGMLNYTVHRFKAAGLVLQWGYNQYSCVFQDVEMTKIYSWD